MTPQSEKGAAYFVQFNGDSSWAYVGRTREATAESLRHYLAEGLEALDDDTDEVSFIVQRRYMTDAQLEQCQDY